MFAMDDDHGNRLYMRVFIDENDKYTNANLYLKLKSEDKHRQLGIVDFQKRTFYCKRNTKKHLHLKTDSFGFNWNILQDPFLGIDYVHLTVDEEHRYLISKTVISDLGKFLNFKSQGFELQKFVSNKILRKYNLKKDQNDIQSNDVSPE